MAFVATQFVSEIVERNGVKECWIDPAVMYPAAVEHIKEVLKMARSSGALEELTTPETGEVTVGAYVRRIMAGDLSQHTPELVATPERGGDARARQLVLNAAQLPDSAWKDALTDRDKVHPEIPFSIDLDLLVRVGASKDAIQAAQRVKQRGVALEIALGWFLQALRLEIGGSNNTIGRDMRYRL